ncbi:hypothetical protein JX266_000142 [Neoarthrinium moseri]|nr:hypothetical protein JX266_000142 [Neoarthrinium moseri]
MAPKRVLLTVRGTVRSAAAKATQLKSTFSQYGPAQLDLVVVPDMTLPGAFDEALKSDPTFDWVIHTASPVSYRNTTAGSNEEIYVSPAVKGAMEVLEGIKRVAPCVTRVVLTSSIAAVIDWNPSIPCITQPARVYTGADWNPTTLEEVRPTADAPAAYRASKTFAERAAWEFVEREKPDFDLVMLCPPMIYGPVFDERWIGRPEELDQSAWNIYSRLLRPGLQSTDPVPPTGLHLYVDVRDIARAHLLSASVPEAGGKRFVICAGEMGYQRIANILRESLPQKRGTIPEGDPGQWSMEEGTYTASSEDAEKVLGLHFITAESTIGDFARQLASIEARGGQ